MLELRKTCIPDDSRAEIMGVISRFSLGERQRLNTLPMVRCTIV